MAAPREMAVDLHLQTNLLAQAILWVANQHCTVLVRTRAIGEKERKRNDDRTALLWKHRTREGRKESYFRVMAALEETKYKGV